MIEEIGKIDQALDELLVNLGGMVLRLASPEITRTKEERQALARSVHQFSSCAQTSKDARVRALAVRLETVMHTNQAPDAASRPHLQLVVSR